MHYSQQSVVNYINTFSFHYMHNPSIKNTKQSRNEFIVLSTLLLGKQPIIPSKINENKYDVAKNNRNFKEKFNSKVEQLTQELNGLKVDGRQINSIMNNEYRASKKNKNMLPSKYIAMDQIRNFHKDKTKILQLNQEEGAPTNTKSYPYIFVDNDTTNEDKIQQNQSNHIRSEMTSNRDILPQIHSNKDIYNGYNHTSLKKEKVKNNDKQLEKIIPPKPIYAKRRQTLDAKYQEDPKNKMDVKKNSNYIQYKQFLFAVNLTNQLVVQPQQEVLYKAYICKGNNGLLVKSIIKNRPWWAFKAEIDSCNLVWTEWKRNKSINLLGTKDHKQAKSEYKQYNLVMKTGNKQIREKGQKKFANFSKIIGKNTTIYTKYEQSIINENYLTFNSKHNNRFFQENYQKNLKDIQFEVLPRDIDRRIVNHIPGCLFLHSKKLLFLSIAKYYERLQRDIFQVIPLTFLVTKGVNDPQFQKFTTYFEEFASKNKNSKQATNIWICKPGENSNRGNGIQVVSTISQIRSLLSQKCGNGRTLIIQKYMENPFLYNKRKFDIRCYILITCVNGNVKGYWYEQGYVRTTSKEYTLKNLDNKLIHLTNDAIQKKGEQYGKFEGFNKISFAQLQKYIENNTEAKFKSIHQKIKRIATDLIISVARKINPHHKEFTFEIFGLDFMLDDKLNPYLIEANSNPCLEVDGAVLGKVIPPMVQNAIRVAIDPIFPPPISQARNRFNPGSTFETNKMALVYDSVYDFPKEQLTNELVEAAQKECQQFQGQVDDE